MTPTNIRNILPTILSNHFTLPFLYKHTVSIIGYGSGVFPQTSSSSTSTSSSPSTNNTVDLIFVVKDTKRFHAQNLTQRPRDYSGLPRILGSWYLDILNSYVFPVHFNHTTTQTTKLKYAVVDYNTFLFDLHRWQCLTLAGRMHKPTAYNILQQPQPKQLKTALQSNYKMGLSIGILNLINKISHAQPIISYDKLFSSICNISYAGDIRHTMAVENKNKVSNIVNHNMEDFVGIYEPVLRELQSGLQSGTIQILNNNNNNRYTNNNTNHNNTNIRIKYTPQLINKLFTKQYMPDNLRLHFQLCYGGMQKYKNITQKMLMNGINLIPKEIDIKLGNINKKSSIKMAMENFLGASLIHNAKYVLAKIKKKGVK